MSNQADIIAQAQQDVVSVGLIDRTRVAVIAATEEPTPEKIGIAQDAIDCIKEQVKGFQDAIDTAAMEAIKLNGPFRVGSILWTNRPETKRECIDVPATLDKAFEVCGGDMGAVAALLTSQPFKPAATVKALGDSSAQFFNVYTRDKLTRDGKEAVRKINTEFLK